MTKQVIAIVGPTASGKTDLSVALAKAVHGEIINGDSMQVYRELDIGTAKITEEEMQGVPHHYFDVLEPTDSFSVAEYQRDVRTYIDEIVSRDKTPIIVGGTGLYVQSVLYDFRFTDEGSDESVRKQLEEEASIVGKEAMHQRLLAVDPKSAKEIHPNNVRRVIRALEIYEVTGQTKSEIDQKRGQKKMYPSTIFGLSMPREQLYERINLRVDLMIRDGLEEEVHALYQKGIRDTQAMRGIGYKEWIPYFEGRMTKEEVIEQIKKNTRQYAKRQLTYFRNKLDVVWLDANVSIEENVQKIQSILND